MSGSERIVLLIKFVFFLSTFVGESDQQFDLTITPIGTEKVIEADSTLNIICILNKQQHSVTFNIFYTKIFSWTVPDNGFKKLGVIWSSRIQDSMNVAN